jgi:exodeoxyribonuclease III
MRIVVWNCAQGLDKKCDRLMSLRPDLAIVPECAEPDVLRKKAPGFEFGDCEWSGELKNKGLGVFAFNGHTLRRHQSWDRRFHLFLPVEVRGASKLNLLATWAFNHRAPATVTPNPVTTMQAITHYEPFLRAHDAIMAGDFNSNIIWDKEGRYSSFAQLNAALEALGLRSAYHAKHGQRFGEEQHPTHFFQWNAAKTFHIDYAYVPDKWLPRVLEVTVGDADGWLAHSDHAPLTVEFGMPA